MTAASTRSNYAKVIGTISQSGKVAPVADASARIGLVTVQVLTGAPQLAHLPATPPADRHIPIDLDLAGAPDLGHVDALPNLRRLHTVGLAQSLLLAPKILAAQLAPRDVEVDVALPDDALRANAVRQRVGDSRRRDGYCGGGSQSETQRGVRVFPQDWASVHTLHVGWLRAGRQRRMPSGSPRGALRR